MYEDNQMGSSESSYTGNVTQEQVNTDNVQSNNMSRAEAKAAKKAAKIQAKTDKQLAKAEKKRNKGKSKVGKVFKFLFAGIGFGAIAGATMYGVCYLGNIALPFKSNEPTQSETVSPVLLEALDKFTNGNKDKSDGSGNSGEQLLPQAPVVSTEEFSVKNIVKDNMPAVVAISGNVTVANGNFIYGGSYQSTTSGTGIIIGKSETELFMVTNAHVVDDVNNLKVTFIDETAAPATVKGSKSEQDIAVISVSISDLDSATLDKISIARIGDSSKVEIGDQVVAIGNALGKGQSVTVGWISALGRSVTIDNLTLNNLIMTDAAINPGNSGGALINKDGEVIGINSAKTALTNVEGMGYAIPISNVADIIERLIAKEERQEVDPDKRGYLGVSCMDITSSISSYYGYPQGIYIKAVVEGSPADDAGLVANDIMVALDDNDIETYAELTELLKYYEVGETVVIDYYHYDSRTNTYSLTSTKLTLGSAKENLS